MKKRYLKKKNEHKKSQRSGTSRDAIEKAERDFQPYIFLKWLDDFTRLRETKSNIGSPSSLEEDSVVDTNDDLDNEFSVESDVESVSHTKKQPVVKRLKRREEVVSPDESKFNMFEQNQNVA